MLLKLQHRPNKENLILAYKILHDILFVVLVFFTMAMIAEGVLPGIVTDHISFTKIIIFIFINLLAIYVLGSFLSVNVSDSRPSKKTALPLLFVSILLIFNSLLKINIYLNLFTLITAIVTGYFVYKVIREE
jgi:hypothetical protein